MTLNEAESASVKDLLLTAYGHASNEKLTVQRWRFIAKELGVNYTTITRWIKSDSIVKHLKEYLIIKARGYLPNQGIWRECYFDAELNLVTPYGVCKPSDIAFVHRYKWFASKSSIRISSLESQLSALSDDDVLNEINLLLETAQSIQGKFKKLKVG